RPFTHLAEHQLGKLHDLGIVFKDPVVSRQATIQRSILHVARHLLSADERAVDLRIVDGRVITAAGKGDFVAGLAEKVAGRLLQAAGGYAELETLSVHFL